MPAVDTAHPTYLTDLFAPVDKEHTHLDLEVEGELPVGLEGLFARNSPNPRFAPTGRYHWFDGDGMIHGVQLEGGKAHYRNRYIRTKAYQLEDAAGGPQWGGILDPMRLDHPHGPIKDTSNTDLTYHNGKLLSLWWLSGQPYELSVDDLSTVGPCDFGGQLQGGGVSAHAKVCPHTGEMIFIDFNIARPPFMKVGVVSGDGKRVKVEPIDLPGARILHDVAITRNHTILMDLPLFYDPAALRRGKYKITFDTAKPSRFGILPRHGGNSDVRWFECPASYIYHTINAWEEDGAIVMTGCRVENPMPKGMEPGGKIPRLYFLELEPFFWRWRFDLETGQVTEEQLDDRPNEFPRMNDAMLGSETRYSYNPRIAPEDRLLFDGLVKFDTDTSSSIAYDYGPGCYGGEAVFAPDPAGAAEDDGWVMTFVHDKASDTHSFIVIDARHFEAGPIARVKLPTRVPIGFHAHFIPKHA